MMAWRTDPIAGQEPAPGTKEVTTSYSRQVWDSTKAFDRNVRLSYISTPWDRVLKDLAQETGSTLVMLDVPPGKFNRQDFRKYTREDAVKILNRELEPEGFRIVIKDQFLTVMQIRRTRREYQRPVAPEHPDDARDQVAQAPSPNPAAEPRRLDGGNTPKPISQTARRVDGNVRRTGFEEVPGQTAIAGGTVIRPKHRSASEIAKQIHATFKKRSRLENAGPNGLPAFVVDHFEKAENQPAATLFTIEIDTQADQLTITGDEAVRKAIESLVARLDVNPLEQEKAVQLIAGNGDLAEVGTRLQKPLTLIAQANSQLPPGQQAAQSNPLGQATPGAAPPAATPDVMPQTPGTTRIDRLPGVLGNLRGDVTIQALEDLDLLILQGNERDVQQVLEVIQAIEQMAIGSLPEIHLLRMRHVDSQSMAALLNDVYGKLKTLRSESAQKSQGNVQVVPVVTPNAVLILAPTNAMDAVLDLAEELDQPIDPDHVVEVFRIKHAVASEVATLLQSFYEQQVGLGTRLKVAADTRTNSVVVQAMPRDLTEVRKVITQIDSDSAASVNQLRIFPLKSAVAEELAAFLSSAVQSAIDPRASTVQQTTTGGFQGQAAQNQAARAAVLEFLTEDGQRLIRSGLLNNIVFNADPRTNSLMVTAPEASFPLLKELIDILDRPSHTVASIKVFPLINADAADAVTLLQELFTQQQQQQTGFNNQTNRTGSLGVELVGAAGSSSALIPMRFSVDSRTNSVVAIGGPEALQIVEAVLLRLDGKGVRNRETTVIKLRNSSAGDIATTINEFLASQRELTQIDPTRISTSQVLEQEVIVTAEPISNSLIISATPAYLDQVIELANRLDAEPSQVYIQALIVEVDLSNNDEFGVELGFQDPILFDRSIIDNLLTVNTTTTAPNGVQTTTTKIVSQQANPGFGFNNLPLGNNNGPASRPSTVGSQGLSNFAVGRTNNDLGYGGLVLSASSESVNVLIRALAARRTIRILSRPQILALDNQLAQIQVGQIVPVADGVTINQNNVIPTVIRDPAGIILTVTPRISPEGQIVMEIAAEKSKYTDQGVTIFTDVTTGSEVVSPIKDITTAQTTVKVPDGQTIVVGGMITKSEDTSERKVPWLGDLPLIGKAFRYDIHDERRTELLIFLTPRVVRCDADAELIKQVETDRMHFFLDEAESIHGPIFGVPPEMQMPLFEEFGPLDQPPSFLPPGPEPALLTPPGSDASVIRGANDATKFQLKSMPADAPVPTP